MSTDPQDLYGLLRRHPGEYCPAEEIRARLACTPGELEGMLDTLRKAGAIVAADPGLGLRLTAIPERLSPAEIRHRLGTGTFGCRVVVVERVASTNDAAAELAATCPAGTVVAAESQSRGRGRRGRRWLAESGSSLLFSLVLPPVPPPAAHSLLVAGAAARALIRHCGVPVRVKWPNDLVVAAGTKAGGDDPGMLKLGGVLCELRNGAAIAGVGLNVNQEQFPPDLPLATSIRQSSGRSFNRNQLLGRILRELEAEYRLVAEAGPEESAERMRQLSITIGRRVTVSTEAGSLTGTAADLNPDGSLVLETDDGGRHRLLTGDVTSAAHSHLDADQGPGSLCSRPGSLVAAPPRERRKMLNAALLLNQVKAQGVTHVVGLPDNGSRALFEALWNEPEIDVINVSREGEAFALASGLYLGGRKPLVAIQNTGFLETGDAFRGTAYNMGIPLVMILGYRGYATMTPGAERVDTAATFFEPTLKAWNIPYSVLFDDSEIEPVLRSAFSRAESTSLPAAVLLCADTG